MSNFLVKIINIEVSNIVGGAQDKSEVTTHTDTTATFGTTLQSPGDSITYNITIENQGTIDAVLKTITKTDTSNSAILFTISGVNEGAPLNAGELVTMQVTVTYNPAVTSQPDDLDSTLDMELDYEQADGGSVGLGPGGETTTIGGQDVPVVDSGDGLYKDEYEDGKYTYKGADPNNYITFNNETWRIISVDSSGLIKIMRNESIGDMVWDNSGLNNWARPATLNSYLNDTYLPTITTNKDKIVSYTWSIGGVTAGNTDLANQINDENGTTWNGNVGLIISSEYLRANSNKEQCGNMSINNTNRESCITTNWMQSIVPSDGYLWMMSPLDSGSNYAFDVYGVPSNAGNMSYRLVYMSSGVVPSLYLTSSITLTGDGSQENPYVIS